MSGKIMGQVWDLALAPTERIVLLALADHADHFGEHARPGVALLAWKTDLSERQVYRVLRELERRGILEQMIEGGGRKRATTYRIHVDQAPHKPPYHRPEHEREMGPETGPRMPPTGAPAASPTPHSVPRRAVERAPETLTPCQGIQAVPETLTSETRNPDMAACFSAQNPDIQMSPQPSQKNRMNHPLATRVLDKQPQAASPREGVDEGVDEGGNGGEALGGFGFLASDPVSHAALALFPTPTNRGEWGKWAKAVTLLHESGAEAEDVRRSLARFRELWPRARPTLMGLARNWAELTQRKAGVAGNETSQPPRQGLTDAQHAAAVEHKRELDRLLAGLVRPTAGQPASR